MIFHLSLKYEPFLLNVEDIPDIKINIEDIKGADGRKNIAILKILSVLKSIMIFKILFLYNFSLNQVKY